VPGYQSHLLLQKDHYHELVFATANMSSRDSEPDSESTLHDGRDVEQGAVANQVRNTGAAGTGLELANNNVDEQAGSNRTDTAQTIDEKDPSKDWMVKFDGDHDPDNPRSMTTTRKWIITMVVAFSSLCV